MKTIVLNGQTHETEAKTVADLVGELNFPQGTVLVEHNGIALRPAEWPSVPLLPDDRLELLRIVAGG